MPDTKSLQYRIVERLPGPARDERADVIARLLADPATTSPKYFYDELGCALYGAICELPEYYPTRTEHALFREHRLEIAQHFATGSQFVDLGAGDCCKAQSWLPFANPSRYIAVDIAGPEIARALARMAPDHPGIEMLGVVTDFSQALDLGDALDARPATFFYPGSSIGNFTPVQATDFLARIRALCEERAGSGLLIGVDAKKDKARLDAAYDDSLGVTAAFNRNLLVHLNRRFGFDFALDGWAHRGFYNPQAGRIEMHLEALRKQRVQLGDAVREFRAGERIHTENSYKYAREEFEAVLREAGFASISAWTIEGGAYWVFFAS